jgi:arsenate reductase
MTDTFEKKRILFICTHNSARSQIAEGLVNSLYSEKYKAFSAGTEPTRINPFAIKVMAEIGIDISKQGSKSLEEFINQDLDWVITVCDNANENCPFFPGGKKRIHKGFKDPTAITGNDIEKLTAFRTARDEILGWIKENIVSAE